MQRAPQTQTVNRLLSRSHGQPDSQTARQTDRQTGRTNRTNSSHRDRLISIFKSQLLIPKEQSVICIHLWPATALVLAYRRSVGSLAHISACVCRCVSVCGCVGVCREAFVSFRWYCTRTLRPCPLIPADCGISDHSSLILRRTLI